MRVCVVAGCPEIFEGASSRCPEHARRADRQRGTASERGYTGAGHRGFRRAVLTRDPVCVLCEIRQSTIADHFPRSRRELIDLGMDPNDPDAGRGLCKPCHDGETARHQPGGWNSGN